jgi:predicted oxidoreductase (fatty acid repression mutant protein)
MVNGHPQGVGAASIFDFPMDSATYLALLERRRSIRRLRECHIAPETLERVQEAILRTPSAYSVPSWHVVIVHQRRAEFWEAIEQGFREGLTGERLERYLGRLDGFRTAAAIALIYEDRQALPELRDAWNLSEETALAFVQQGIGMVQLSIWLALTAEGLVTSLQHWDWLVQERLARLLDLPSERFRLAATMPIGYPAEEPRTNLPIERHRVLSVDRQSSAMTISGNGHHP